MMSSIVTFQLPHYNVHVDKKRMLSIIEVPIIQLFLPPRVSLLFFLLVQPNIVQVEVNTPPW